MYVDQLTGHIQGLPPDLQRLILQKALALRASLRRTLETYAARESSPRHYTILVRRTTGKPRDFRVVQGSDYKRSLRSDGFYDVDYRARVPHFYVRFQQKVRRGYEDVAEHAHPDVIAELADMVLTDTPEEYVVAVVTGGRLVKFRLGTYSRRDTQAFVGDAHRITEGRFDV